MKTYRIMLADDHAMFRKGVKQLIDAQKGMRVVGEASDGVGLIEKLKTITTDMVILDISMPGPSGFVLLREIKNTWPHILVLMLTMHKDLEYLDVAMNKGASGYLLKEDSDLELFDAIEQIRAGNQYITRNLAEEMSDYLRAVQNGKPSSSKDALTLREGQVLKLIAEGMANKDIASLLNISIRTVENHRSNIMKKLNLSNTAQLVRYSLRKDFMEMNV